MDKTYEAKLDAKHYLDAEDYPAALEVIMKILDENPDDADALFLFGSVAIKQDKRGLAYNLFRRCAALNPDSAAVWVNYGRSQPDTPEGWQASLDCFTRALAIDSKNVAAMSNIATLYIQNTQPHDAKIWAKRCVKADPDYQPGLNALAFAYLMEGKWEKGWKLYENMLGSKYRQDIHYGGLPLWDGSPGETVIVYGEQGIGDEILYSSVLEDMSKDCKVIYDTMPRLESLLKRSLPSVFVTGSRWQNQIEIPPELKPTARIPAAGVPVYYRKKEQDFKGEKYLEADPTMRKAMRGLLDSISDKPKIGIAWTGGSERTRGHLRTQHLEDLMQILRIPDVDFISLQYTDPTEEIEKFKENKGLTIHHFSWITEIKDYDLTAALVAELDLVISVPTSVTQLAGGLGVDTWVMVPEITGWLFCRDDYPWAKSVKLYHDWTPKRIGDDLKERLKKQEAA